MPVTASTFFDFLEAHPVCAIDRREVADPAFGIVRRSLREIVFMLQGADDNEAAHIANVLRALLSEWLTVPVVFDEAVPKAIMDTFGGSEVVRSRWGNDIARLYEASVDGARQLINKKSPMREELRAVVGDLMARSRAFKVYCHRRARAHFESIQAGIPAEAFLHTPRDYRESELFDVLVKAGPLRSRGWGAAADALITAPRFSEIIQVVWAGCNDEADFGYDPAAVGDAGAHRREQNGWTTRIQRIGEDKEMLGYAADLTDELQLFRTLDEPHEKRAATLVELAGQSGILYPPSARVLSFDPQPAAQSPISQRSVDDALTEGMFVITEIVDDVNLGGVHAEHGHYSRIWKTRLEQEWRADAGRLTSRLRAAGLNLVHLGHAIRLWSEPPSNVIHAPQQLRHFEVLIDVLGLGRDQGTARGAAPHPWWQLAWNEIRRSRGEAIQAGVHEREVVEEQLMDILRRMLPELREKARSGPGFVASIPAGSGIRGTLLFHRVAGFEFGFSVPDADLKKVRDLHAFDQWRS